MGKRIFTERKLHLRRPESEWRGESDKFCEAFVCLENACGTCLRPHCNVPVASLEKFFRLLNFAQVNKIIFVHLVNCHKIRSCSKGVLLLALFCKIYRRNWHSCGGQEWSLWDIDSWQVAEKRPDDGANKFQGAFECTDQCPWSSNLVANVTGIWVQQILSLVRWNSRSSVTHPSLLPSFWQTRQRKNHPCKQHCNSFFWMFFPVVQPKCRVRRSRCNGVVWCKYPWEWPPTKTAGYKSQTLEHLVGFIAVDSCFDLVFLSRALDEKDKKNFGHKGQVLRCHRWGGEGGNTSAGWGWGGGVSWDLNLSLLLKWRHLTFWFGLGQQKKHGALIWIKESVLCRTTCQPRTFTHTGTSSWTFYWFTGDACMVHLAADTNAHSSTKMHQLKMMKKRFLWMDNFLKDSTYLCHFCQRVQRTDVHRPTVQWSRRGPRFARCRVLGSLQSTQAFVKRWWLLRDCANWILRTHLACSRSLPETKNTTCCIQNHAENKFSFWIARFGAFQNVASFFGKWPSRLTDVRSRGKTFGCSLGGKKVPVPSSVLFQMIPLLRTSRKKSTWQDTWQIFPFLFSLQWVSAAAFVDFMCYWFPLIMAIAAWK